MLSALNARGRYWRHVIMTALRSGKTGAATCICDILCFYIRSLDLRTVITADIQTVPEPSNFPKPYYRPPNAGSVRPSCYMHSYFSA
jgi:hypothetical protein